MPHSNFLTYPQNQVLRLLSLTQSHEAFMAVSWYRVYDSVFLYFLCSYLVSFSSLFFLVYPFVFLVLSFLFM